MEQKANGTQSTNQTTAAPAQARADSPQDTGREGLVRDLLLVRSVLVSDGYGVDGTMCGTVGRAIAALSPTP